MNLLKSLTRKNEFVSSAMCVLLVILLTVKGEVFWTKGNLDSLQASIAPTAIMAFGMMALLVCGYFDLSIGSTMLLAGMVSGRLALAGAPIYAIVALVLITGCAVGCTNGFLVAKLRINALIATIGTQYIFYGIAMTQLDKVRALGKFPENFIMLGEGKALGLYYMTWVTLALLAVFSYFLKYTPTGRQLYFLGGNREAARLMGFNDRRIIFAAYAATGLLASLAGILAAARIQSPSQYMGGNVHMTCMIACVVGGGSFAGGKGSALGAVLGVAFMSLLTNMFNLLELKAQLQNVIVGLILVTVIVTDGCLNLKKLREIGRA
ncbi:MAG: ABC transporter permease [Synergistaceae bacterium]|jgi:ribose transport system permease protein|nr:ABC transporter permease [Synergistaceae bacterium]